MRTHAISFVPSRSPVRTVNGPACGGPHVAWMSVGKTAIVAAIPTVTTINRDRG